MPRQPESERYDDAFRPGATRRGLGREWAVAIAVHSGLAIALLFPALTGGALPSPGSVIDNDPLYRTGAESRRPGGGDFTLPLVDLPRDLTIAQALRAGRLPGWNPLSAAGAPLWAEQAGPFFPLKLPFYLAPSQSTYVAFLGLRLIFAGLGAWALARARGLTQVGGLAAGVGFELSGAMVEPVPFGASSPICMLPWVVLGAEAIARTRGATAVVLTAAALGLAASGGHPALIVLVFASFAATLAMHVVASLRDPRRAAITAGLGATALLLGVLLAAPSLLPFAELAAYGSSYKRRELGAFNWETTIAHSRATLPPALLAPHLLQRMYSEAGLGPLFEGFASLGAVGLVMALAGILGRGVSLPLAGLAGLGIALALAPPGLGWMSALPGLRAISAYYAWPLVVLPLTQAAGTGVERLASPGGVRAATIALVLAALACRVLLLAGVAAVPIGDQTLATLFGAALEQPGARLLLFGPLAAVLVALGVILAARGRAGRWAGGLVVALLAIELLVLWRPSLQRPAAAALHDSPSPAVAWLQARLADGNARMVGVPFWVGFPLTPMVFGLPDLRGHSALPVQRYLDYMQLIEQFGSLITVQTTGRPRSPLLDLAAVRYVVVERGAEPPRALLDGDPVLARVYVDEHVAIYENRAAVPRVRIMHRSEPVADAAAALDRLRQLVPGRSHVDAALSSAVRLEPAEDGAPPPRLDGAAIDGESVRIVDATDPDGLAIEAELSAPGVVVVADTYYPGWTATVDGQPAPIFPADLLFRAVAVAPGRHTIELRYAPASFRWGVALFGLGLVACVGLLVAQRVAAGASSRRSQAAGVYRLGMIGSESENGR